LAIAIITDRCHRFVRFKNNRMTASCGYDIFWNYDSFDVTVIFHFRSSLTICFDPWTGAIDWLHKNLSILFLDCHPDNASECPGLHLPTRTDDYNRPMQMARIPEPGFPASSRHQFLGGIDPNGTKLLIHFFANVWQSCLALYYQSDYFHSCSFSSLIYY